MAVGAYGSSAREGEPLARRVPPTVEPAVDPVRVGPHVVAGGRAHRFSGPGRRDRNAERGE